MMNARFVTLACMVFAGAAMRLIPHPPNFVPIAAMALFGGAYFSSKRAAFGVPLAAMFLSDLVISGGYHPMLPIVYGCFLLMVALGMLIRTRRTPLYIGGAALACSILFFIATNFAEWVRSPLYSKTLAGLTQCYVVAIPYFRNSLIGNVFYVGLLFGVFALATRRISVLRDPTETLAVRA